MSNYNGSSGSTIRRTGGSSRVTIASNVGQGNGGTSLPCAGCYVSPSSGNTSATRIQIGAACTDSTGIEINDADAGGPLWIPIDDVSSLYFYGGTDGDTVDILYFRG